MYWQYIVAGIVSLVGSLIGGFLGSYVKKRGENWATKKDIEGITKIVENVKSDLVLLVNKRTKLFDIQIEVLKNVYKMCLDVHRYISWTDIHTFLEDNTDTIFLRKYIALSRELNEYFKENSIFLPLATENAILKLIESFGDFYSKVIRTSPLKNGKSKQKLLGEIQYEIDIEFPKRLELLKVELSKMIDR